MASLLIKSDFSKFFSAMAQYTDLLLKITEAKKIVVPPEKEKEIYTKLLVSEKRQIHEAFVLKMYVAWELLVENVFIECLYRDPSGYARHKMLALPVKLTRDICRGLVSGLGYFDFRNTDDLKGKAKKALVDRFNPFAVLPRDATDRIDEFYVIRNYLAHYSDSSRQSLAAMYRRKYNLPFQEPGKFFFEYDTHNKQIRFANYTNAFLKAADEMALFLNV
jgi:hypothetical protein